jgi:hypothetical protein
MFHKILESVARVNFISFDGFAILLKLCCSKLLMKSSKVEMKYSIFRKLKL